MGEIAAPGFTVKSSWWMTTLVDWIFTLPVLGDFKTWVGGSGDVTEQTPCWHFLWPVQYFYNICSVTGTVSHHSISQYLTVSLSDRHSISGSMRHLLDEATEPWGIKVLLFILKLMLRSILLLLINMFCWNSSAVKTMIAQMTSIIWHCGHSKSNLELKSKKTKLFWCLVM